MGEGVSPPVVTLVEPEDPDIGDPVGAERPFTASCDQPATLTVYLDDNLVHTSASGVREVSYTFPSAPLGQHMVRVVAANANGTGENYWTWNVVSTPPVVIRVAPLEQAISDDSPDATRVFEIAVDQSARIIFYHNGDVIYDSGSQTLTSCSVPFSAHRYGEHVITAVALNANGRGTLHWTWTISRPLPPPEPPEITLIWPNTTTPSSYAGARVVFAVQVTPPAQVKFYLDEEEVLSIDQLTGFANYVDDSALVGPHIIRITAHNTEGSDQLLVHWTVHEPDTPPALSLSVPDTISNLQGEVRIILAHVTTPCTIPWFIDGVCVAEMRGDPLTFAYFGYNTSKLSVGQHSLTVTAGNQQGSDSKTVTWTISDPYDIVRQVHGEDVDIEVGGVLKTTATLNERGDGSRFIEIAYNTGIGLDLMKDQHTGDLIPISGNFDIEVTVSWPILTIPNTVVNYPKTKIHSDTPSNHGSLSIEVPNSSYYYIDVNLAGTCKFFPKLEGVPIPILGFTNYNYHCNVYLSLQ
ncbi:MULTISPECIES: hypothetical protein [unclassified Methanoculleus]|jgi:hypothetical protein|uniref:hypothetical protein n=1 Tax=unclassified Methanoculleus TaxID=2619537 RepID=UPI00319DC6B2